MVLIPRVNQVRRCLSYGVMQRRWINNLWASRDAIPLLPRSFSLARYLLAGYANANSLVCTSRDRLAARPSAALAVRMDGVASLADVEVDRHEKIEVSTR